MSMIKADDESSDVVQQVDHVACLQSGFVEHKMCEVESFVDSQSWATGEVDWDICFE
jgi:hypothetical protein